MVKGDGKYVCIGGGCIVGKRYGDDYMNEVDKEYGFYDWNSNKGYGSKKDGGGMGEDGRRGYDGMSFNLLGRDGELEIGL